MTDDRQTCTLPEAARMLGISERTGERLAAQGEFPVPVLRMGRTRRVARHQLERYINGGAEPAPVADVDRTDLATRIEALHPEERARVEGFIAGIEASRAWPPRTGHDRCP